MAKICRKHKKEFFGLRCPICTAPPVVKSEDPEEKLPFSGETIGAPIDGDSRFDGSDEK